MTINTKKIQQLQPTILKGQRSEHFVTERQLRSTGIFLYSSLAELAITPTWLYIKLAVPGNKTLKEPIPI